ncbi:MAG: MATE family efflux transporter [Clostridia bacterium]|nr:MATE family efflux transporter [Clostridia bacterium]
MNFKKLFLDRQFWRVALSLAVPIALQNLLSASFSLVDTFMVGKLGGDYLAAMGMAGQWSWLLSIFSFGLVSGTSLFIAQYWGIKDIKSINRTTGIAVSSTVIIALIFTVVGITAPETIMKVFSRTPEIVEYGSTYLRIAAYSYPAVALTLILSAVLRSTEKVKLPVVISLITALSNAILNYCLIFGVMGFPEMGIAGAAVATCISSWAGTIVLIFISICQKNILIAPLRALFGFNWHHIVQYYRRALPIILNEAAWGLGTVAINAIFSNMGDDYYTGVTIYRTFENIFYVFIIGYCSACSVMIGKSIGSGKIKRAKEDAWRFTATMPVICILTGTIVVLCRGQLVSLFTSGADYTAAAVSAALSCLLVYGCEMPIRNIPYLMIVGIFRPGGNSKLALILDLVCLWALAIPFSIFFAFVLKLPFVTVFIFMFLTEDVPKAIMCLICFIRDKWISPVTEEGKAAFEELKKEKENKKLA